MIDQCDSERPRKGPRGGVAMPFPEKLHVVLSHEKYSDVISWQPHGRCFILHNPQEFLRNIMPKHFRQSKLTSFQRQLNLYGFCRITSGPDKGSYYHELFLRGKPHLCTGMVRVRVKGTGNRSSSSQEAPNFYSMPPVDPEEVNDISMRWHETSDTSGYKCAHADSSLQGRSSMISVTSSSSFISSDSDVPASTQERLSPPAPIVSRRKRTPKATRSPKLLGVSISVPVSPPMQSQGWTSEMESFDLGESNHIPVQDELVMFEGKSFHYIESICIQEKTELSNVGRRRSVTFDEGSIFSASKRLLLSSSGSTYPISEKEPMEDLVASTDISSENLLNIQSFPRII